MLLLTMTMMLMKSWLLFFEFFEYFCQFSLCGSVFFRLLLHSSAALFGSIIHRTHEQEEEEEEEARVVEC
jgi:hypothetical protein